MATGGDDEGIRVLVVDDEPGLAEVAKSFFERRDEQFEVVAETSATAALDRLARSDDGFDCIVSDYDMPRMDGLQFREAVHRRCADVPFVLFTTEGREAFEGGERDVDCLRKDALDGGFDELVEHVSSVTGAEAT
ncbi:MAG: response regulator [Halorientalis sp.]